VQTMSILVVNQSVIDMCAAFFSLPLKNDIRIVTGLSHDSAYDQFVCRFWLTRRPLWCMLATSTYGIVIMTLSRYIAVIYPICYKIVRIRYCFLVCWIKPRTFIITRRLWLLTTIHIRKAFTCINRTHWKLVALDHLYQWKDVANAQHPL